jgi:hypothetical protein
MPIEGRHTERFMTNPSREPREAERAEAALIRRSSRLKASPSAEEIPSRSEAGRGRCTLIVAIQQESAA